MRPNANPPIGILLMAYGGPDSLDEVEPYLRDVRGGRPTSPEWVETIKGRYARIGGRSPLLQITREQAAALEAHLNQDGNSRFRAYVGMRHGSPRIKDTVAHMAEDGIKQAVALVLAPHYSQMSIGAYFRQLDEAIHDLGVDVTFNRVKSWHNHPGLISALAEKVTAALPALRPAQGGAPAGVAQVERFAGAWESPLPKVMFTAHSLPTRILEWGDPYDAQVRETAGLLARRLGLPADRWLFCYQSAVQSREPWLGPPIEDVIVELAQAGEKHLLVVPIGFVADHVEVLYDIDIAGRELAEASGARLERSESLNTSPAFIATLADLVLRESRGLRAEDRGLRTED